MNERCEKAMHDAVKDFERIHAKWQELKAAYTAFLDRKEELAFLLSGCQADFEKDSTSRYPSEEDKAAISKSISECDDNELADTLVKLHPDLGGLAGEARMEFTARAFIQEAAKRLARG